MDLHGLTTAATGSRSWPMGGVAGDAPRIARDVLGVDVDQSDLTDRSDDFGGKWRWR